MRRVEGAVVDRPRPPRPRHAASERAGSAPRIITARPAHPDPADDALELIRDESFDQFVSDEDIDVMLATLAKASAVPHAELMRRMLGMEELHEQAARVLLRRVLDHRRRLSKALGREVHVRVAALDLHSLRPPRRHESRPIVVTSSLVERALEEASADALTGLPQRAHFLGLLRHELRQRRRRNLAVVYVDLDGMKRVNDTFGHARGDEVLRAFSRSGRATLRQGDVLARIGGDEFALLLVDVTPAEASAAVARLRHRFEARTASLRTSFSAGIAMGEAGVSADELLARADAAMYRDKRSRAERS